VNNIIDDIDKHIKKVKKEDHLFRVSPYALDINKSLKNKRLRNDSVIKPRAYDEIPKTEPDIELSTVEPDIVTIDESEVSKPVEPREPEVKSISEKSPFSLFGW